MAPHYPSVWPSERISWGVLLVLLADRPQAVYFQIIASDRYEKGWELLQEYPNPEEELVNINPDDFNEIVRQAARVGESYIKTKILALA